MMKAVLADTNLSRLTPKIAPKSQEEDIDECSSLKNVVNWPQYGQRCLKRRL